MIVVESDRIESDLVRLAARIRGHMRRFGCQVQEQLVQARIAPLLEIAISYLSPISDGTAFTEPKPADSDSLLATRNSQLPLVSIGQGTSRRDYYESDFSRVGGSAEGGFTHGADSRKVGGSAEGGFTHGADTTIHHAGPKASKNHRHFLSSAGMA